MTDEAIARAAAKRWGKIDPTFDAVIMEHTPDYQTNERQRARWHHIKDLALDLLGIGNCHHCGSKCGKNRFCDDECRNAAVAVPRYCAAPKCSKQLKQRKGEGPWNFLGRQTCCLSCASSLAKYKARKRVA